MSELGEGLIFTVGGTNGLENGRQFDNAEGFSLALGVFCSRANDRRAVPQPLRSVDIGSRRHPDFRWKTERGTRPGPFLGRPSRPALRPRCSPALPSGFDCSRQRIQSIPHVFSRKVQPRSFVLGQFRSRRHTLFGAARSAPSGRHPGLAGTATRRPGACRRPWLRTDSAAWPMPCWNGNRLRTRPRTLRGDSAGYGSSGRSRH
jgi:hypothetical protein